MKWLSGKKTYIASILTGLVGLAWSMGWITEEVAVMMGSVFAAITGISMRLGIAKSGTDWRQVLANQAPVLSDD
jgi:hypothetical protein